ncbi:hypothetical protein DITRI_Ditri04bG0008000 [Diplodiscus trichospermus]
MSSVVSQRWQEKASGFVSSSGVKIKEAGQTAGTFVGEVAKDAKGNVTDVAERFGSMVKSRWAILREPATKHAVQENLILAAATTGTFFRKGITGTKDKVAVGKTKVEEVAKKTAQKSKIILTDIERWQRVLFGVPIEVTVQRQQSSRPIPLILVKCADYLVLSGLNSQYLFKAEGDKKVIQQLVSIYNQDFNASIPEGLNPIDVAALAKYYIASLPEPLITFELYNEIKGAHSSSSRSSIHAMRNVLKKLPSVNYMTIELVTALLLRVSQKSVLNKMDARSLAMEMAPVIMWQKDRKPESYRKYWSHPPKSPSKGNMDSTPAYSAWDMLADDEEDMDASSHIPLDDGMPVDFGAIEVIQCLIEQHNPIFTDANETVWR